ncbi:MAG: choice-of-anchor L domain-containing protein [Planctomycetota bacterium]|jgi:hypothetical protein
MRPLSIFVLLTLCFALLFGCGGGSGSSGGGVSPKKPTNDGNLTVSIDSPTTDISYLSKENKINLSGSAADDKAVTSVAWSTDTGFQGNASGTDAWSVKNIPLKEGDTKITVTAHDAKGNVAEQKITVTYNAYLIYHGEPEVNPFAVFTNTATDVITRIAILPNQNLIEDSVKLFKVNASGQTVQELGRMYDDGNLDHGDDIKGDGVFSAKTNFIEPKSGDVHLRAIARTNEKGAKVDAYTKIFVLSVVDPIADAVVADAVSVQEQAQDKYYDDAAVMSEEKALESTVNWLKKQAGVEDASVTSSGDIWIEFTSGLSGLVHCGGDKEEGGSSSTKMPSNRNALVPDIAVDLQTTGAMPMAGPNPPKNTDPNAVLNTKAILYAPYHTQFSGWGTEFLDSLNTRLNNVKKPKFKTTYLKNGAASVDALAGLTGYGLIVFHCHGGVDSKGNVILSTGEVFSLASYKKHALKYLTKQLTIVTIHGKSKWAFLPKFITSLPGTFPKSIVYAGACSSSKTSSMSSAFLSKNANTYFGFNQTVYGWFDKKMADQLFPKLIDQNKTTGESFTPNQHDTHTPAAYFTMAGNAKAYFKVGLINGDFELGDLTGWTKNGDGRVISQLGYIIPWEKSFMGIISTGLGYTTDSGSISQEFWVDPDNTTLTLKWNFLSEEFMEYVGSQYQDFFQVRIIDEQGDGTTIFYKAIDDIANGYSLTHVSPGIVFDKGDVYATGWVFSQHSLLQWADQNVTLELSCGDVGDSIYDTAVLLDAIVAGN